jgi:hypothetical protein
MAHPAGGSIVPMTLLKKFRRRFLSIVCYPESKLEGQLAGAFNSNRGKIRAVAGLAAKHFSPWSRILGSWPAGYARLAC